MSEKRIVELGINARARIELNGLDRVLVIEDDHVQIRMTMPLPTHEREFPYMLAAGLGYKLELLGNELRRYDLGLAWQHGPFTGPGPARL